MFVKGRQKTGGRQKGTPNKKNSFLGRIVDFVNSQDIEADLTEFKKTNPVKYWDLVSKLFPKDLTIGIAEDSEPVQFVIRGYNDKNHSSSAS